MPTPSSRGMQVFFVIWLGQLVSLVGSGLTGFALGLWVYQRSGSVTQFAFTALFTVLPNILLSPVAGVLVDRWDRRRTMILGDAGAALSTLAVAILFLTGRLEVWHIYIAASVSSACSAFQTPAYLALITHLVPKQQLGRTGGMVQIGQAASDILAPALAGLLVVTIQVGGVLLIDFVTFLFAVLTLLAVRVPERSERSEFNEYKMVAEDRHGRQSLLSEATYGWTYIAARPGLLGLLIFLAATNLFLGGMVGPLITPMMLEVASPQALGLVISIAGGGMLLSSLAMSAWGGPRRRIAGLLGFELLCGLFIMLIGLRPSVGLIALGAFGAHFTLPIINGSNLAIWQSKVAPAVQGRVFAAQQAIAKAATPLAYLTAGPLADKVFGPALLSGGPLAGSVGQIVGVGPGRGIGLLFIVMGILTLVATIVAYLNPRIRLVEGELPDAIAGEGAMAIAEAHPVGNV